MIVTKTSNLSKSRYGKPDIYVESADTDLKNLFLAMQGRIRFGEGEDGSKGENLQGRFQQFTSDATPDTEFAVAHEVGSTPIGSFIFWQDKAGSLYQGPTTGTSWDSTNAYFKSDIASVTFLVFFLQ